MSYKEDIDSCFKLILANELSNKIQKLITICHENLHHTQEVQKQVLNKSTKPRNNTSGDKIWLNSKNIKTKWNQKLKAKFFGSFRVLHLVGKQTYKLELPKKWRIYDIFYLSLLEQDPTRKGPVDENVANQVKFKANNNEKYKVEGIQDSVVYEKKSENGHLLGFYYLVL